MKRCFIYFVLFSFVFLNGCVSGRLRSSQNVLLLSNTKNELFLYLNEVYFEDIRVDEKNIFLALDSVNDLIASKFGNNRRFSFLIQMAEKSNTALDPFEKKSIAENGHSFEKISLHLKKCTLLNVLEVIASQSRYKLKIGDSIVFVEQN